MVLDIFYYGIGWGNDLKIPADHILISASACWKKYRGGYRFEVPNILSEPITIWLDSGGYTCFTKWKDYPWTVEQYVNFVRLFCIRYPQTEYVSVLDLPCEPLVNRSESNVCRIHQTIKNTRDCLSYKIPANWVSVIQGYSKWEYKYCANLMHHFGLFTPVTAIGSVCQRKGTKQLDEIVRFITTLADVKWHTFGLQLRALSTLKDVVHSSDSGAWKFRSKRGAWKPKTYEHKLKNYWRYRFKIETQIIGDFRYENLCAGV